MINDIFRMIEQLPVIGSQCPVEETSYACVAKTNKSNSTTDAANLQINSDKTGPSGKKFSSIQTQTPQYTR